MIETNLVQSQKPFPYIVLKMQNWQDLKNDINSSKYFIRGPTLTCFRKWLCGSLSFWQDRLLSYFNKKKKTKKKQTNNKKH
jgi:hypothetical protein